MKPLLALTAAIALTLAGAADSLAQRTYSPAQLHKMIRAGTFPQQGPPSTKTQAAPFRACVSQVESVIASVAPNYPTRTVVSTGSMRVEKLWTNDAAMTLSCSAADQKLIITSAPYR